MIARLVLVLAACALAACDRAADTKGGVPAEAPSLVAPTPVAEPGRTFAPSGAAASAATGELNYALALRMPDAAGGGGEAQEILTLRGANGLTIEATLASAQTPAAMVDGQTLRGLMGLPVEATQALVYKVIREAAPEGGAGLCGASPAAFLVLWEPEGPGEPILKVFAVSGAAPGERGAKPCAALDYRRA